MFLNASRFKVKTLKFMFKVETKIISVWSWQATDLLGGSRLKEISVCVRVRVCVVTMVTATLAGQVF